MGQAVINTPILVQNVLGAFNLLLLCVLGALCGTENRFYPWLRKPISGTTSFRSKRACTPEQKYRSLTISLFVRP
jgi:hypothetical protein